MGESLNQFKKGFDFIGLSVVYFCHDGKGTVVFGHRNDSARDERGRWDIGGGAVEFGDSLETTLRKEIKEEYGTDVISYEFLGFREVFRKIEGKKTHWLAMDFKVLIDPSMVKNGEPHKFHDVRLFTLANMPSPIHSQLPIFLEKYKDKL